MEYLQVHFKVYNSECNNHLLSKDDGYNTWLYERFPNAGQSKQIKHKNS